MDRNQLKNVIAETKKAFYESLDKTTPGLDKNTKYVYWLERIKVLKSETPSLWPYDIKDDDNIPDFIIDITKAENELKQKGLLIKKSMTEFFSEPVKQNNINDFKTRVRNTVYKVQNNDKKDWFLTTLSEKDLLHLSVEQIVINYEDVFDLDIVTKCKENLENYKNKRDLK